MAKNQITLLLTDDLLKWVKEQAKKENRSLNNYIETVLINKFKKEGK